MTTKRVPKIAREKMTDLLFEVEAVAAAIRKSGSPRRRSELLEKLLVLVRNLHGVGIEGILDKNASVEAAMEILKESQEGEE